MTETNDTISLEQVIRVLRRRRWVLLQCLLAGAAVGAVLAVSSPEPYEATATALVGSEALGDEDQSGPGLSAPSAARLVRTKAVAEAVRSELGDRRSAQELLGAVSAEADRSGSFVTITGRDDTPDGAARLANAFAGQFIDVRAEIQRDRLRQRIVEGERQVAALAPGSSERRRLAAELAELRARTAFRGADAQVIDPAVPGGARDELRPVRFGAVGAALGLLVGLVIAFALQALDPRVRTLEDLRRLLRAPQLAALPESTLRGRMRARGKAPVLSAPREPFEHLRGALLVFHAKRELRRLVVTSPSDRRDGKDAVAASLAVALARMGLRVCAVDADLRRPRLASEFGLDASSPGLADVVRGTSLADTIQRFAVPGAPAAAIGEGGGNGAGPSAEAAVSVLAAGQPDAHPAEMLASHRMRAVLDELESAHDIVILDCAPLLDASDVLALVEHASGTILVVRHSRTPRRAITRAAQLVEEAQGSVLGLVATGVPGGELRDDGFGPWPGAVLAESGRES